MARRPADMGRNLGRPSNPLGQLPPSFPAPAINSAQGASQALLQGNNELVVPPTVAPQSSYLFGGTVPQAHRSDTFQQVGGGAGRIHSSGVAQPLQHGREFAALVANLNNNLPAQPLQPSGLTIGWPLGQPYGPQTQHQQPNGAVTRYPGPQPIKPRDSGVWGLLSNMPPAPGARFTRQQPTGAVAPHGSNAGAPPVGSNRYGATSWAPRPAGPAYLVGSGRAAQTGLASKPTKSLEEYLCEQGVPVPVLDDTDSEYNALVAELLRDPAEEPGRVESAGLRISAGGNWLPPPAVGFRSGPSRDQLGLGTVRFPEPPSFRADAVGGRSYGRAAAAAARDGRRKKMVEKKVVAAKARAQKLAAARGSLEGT